MDIATAIALTRYVPLMVSGIKEGAEIVERLTAGDVSAEQAAQDWLGITGKVEEAIAEWEASQVKSD